MSDDRKRALRRIRRAVTEAIDWNEIAAFAGGGDPNHHDYKVARAEKARKTLDRIIQEELDHAYCRPNRSPDRK